MQNQRLDRRTTLLAMDIALDVQLIDRGNAEQEVSRAGEVFGGEGERSRAHSQYPLNLLLCRWRHLHLFAQSHR